jgi:hypothetical protein
MDYNTKSFIKTLLLVLMTCLMVEGIGFTFVVFAAMLLAFVSLVFILSIMYFFKSDWF